MNEKKFHFEYHCWILNCFCSKLLSKIRKKKPIHCEILHVVEPEHINRQMINQTSANDLHKKHILGLKVDKLMLSLITSKPRHRKECQYKYTLKGYWSVYFISFSYLMCHPYLQCTFTDASHSFTCIHVK